MQAQGLVLSDLHVGSVHGLHPPGFKDDAGNILEQNEGQQYLWKCFSHLLSRAASRPIEFVVFNGDILDGPQKKEYGIPLTLHRPDDQRSAAKIVLKEVIKLFPKAKYYFVEGTPYHEHPDEVKQVAVNLLGEDHFKGRHVVVKTLRLAVGKAVIQFHHEVSFSSGFTKAASLEKEFIYDLLAEADHGWTKADCFIRSHCHYFQYFGRANKLALITPCWQLQSGFVTKSSPTKNIPNIGGVVLSVDDSLIEYGLCPVGFTEYLYQHPKPQITDLQDSVEVCDEGVTTSL